MARRTAACYSCGRHVKQAGGCSGQGRCWRPRQPVDHSAFQAKLAAFVTEHNIGCFDCGTTKAEWAKTGLSKRGPWAVCLSCVRAHRKKNQPGQAA